MSNWFQDHPATGIITYTLVIVGATWAASTFVLQDNRLNLARSELESQKAVAEQYKAKTELLQSDISTLRSENQEYRAWLAQSKDALPIMVPQLIDLKRQVEEMKAKPPAIPELVANAPSPTPSSPTPTPMSPPAVKKPIPRGFSEVRVAKLGSAGVDEITGAIVTVLRTTTSRTAKLTLAFPGRPPVTDDGAYPGKQYRFDWGGRTITLTLLEIEFFTDTVKFRLNADA